MSWLDLGPGARIAACWVLLATVVLASAIPRMDRLGLYYDEAFLAQQARDFVEPERAGTHAGSVRTTWLMGRPFPLRNAAYLGSLKSQLLIPPLAIFGSSAEVVRIATLVTGLFALLLAMWTAGRFFGHWPAMLTGLLVASDPSFYFLAQFEWGPFTTNLLCRSAGMLLLVIAWQSAHPRRALLAAISGGAALGLGIFSRADFAIILASVGIALVLVRPGLVALALRERRGLVLASLAALLVAASSMIGSAFDLFGSSGIMAERGGWETRASVLFSVIDGSHFYRLMQTGGRFDEALEVAAISTLFGWVLALACIVLSAYLVSRWRSASTSHRDAALGVLLLSAALLSLAMLAMPGAVRAHHQLNTLPLLHLIVACAATWAWRWPTAPSLRSAVRAGVVLLLAAVLVSQIRVIVLTQELIDETGGKGRWTRALHDLADEIDSQGTRVVSLDWGFHEPMQLLTDHAELLEAIWTIPRVLGRGQPWVIAGDARSVYLVHDAPYDLFGLGPLFLARMREEEPEAVEIRTHRDASGEVAFYSVRVLRPHRLAYTGRFVLD
ncbi:MAG: glycosyltransferase family 39 protein [Deltaproteobacteria bacterium]|nr:glycosyltransferase family 39 protein [Deltaproteobacteria bacterium]MBW2696475.1 glycosyltransferase family 39 protein [Deltaproteobacteria bacterium]